VNAAIYARYSSELQRATSIEDQVRLCREAAERLGYAVAPGHVFSDHEISGANAHRPGYRRLLAAARERAFDAIVVEAQDRLWRDAAEMHSALRLLRFLGVRVLSVATGTDLTDRAGKILAAVVGLKDELFLDDLRDKTRRGMEGTIRRGLSAGGRAYGYRSEPVHDDAGRTVGYRRVIDPAEAEVVRYIYRLYGIDGLTPRAIAHRLNAERVPPPRTARGRHGGSWTPATILGGADRALGILRNPLYAGRIAWNRSRKVRDPDTGRRLMRVRPQAEWVWADAPDLRIVPPDLWERVRARLRQRAWTPGKREGARPKYLLSGMLVCADCGGRYVAQKRRGRVRYYACAVHFDRGPSVCPNSRLVRQDRVEREILAYVFGDMFAPHRVAYLERAVDAALKRALDRSTDTAAERETALRQARRELDNIAAAIRAGVITPTTKTMLEDAERRVAALEQAVRNAHRPAVPVVPVRTVVERYLRDLRGLLSTNVDEARRLLSLALDKIVLRTEGGHVVARITGKMSGLLTLGGLDVVASVGAGRGIWKIPLRQLRLA
jgi:site-specific DNA recombinase